MARPRKFYVVWLEYGGAVIVHGLATARKTGNAWKAFDTAEEAEEWISWWDYTNARH